jgi:hypothetical protein
MPEDTKKYRQVENIIRRSKTLILNVKLLGADTSHAKEMLNNAKNALDNGDYNSAIDFAKKSMVEVMELKKKIENGEIQPAIPEIAATSKAPPISTDQSSLPSEEITNSTNIQGRTDIPNSIQQEPQGPQTQQNQKEEHEQQVHIQQMPDTNLNLQGSTVKTDKEVITPELLDRFEDSFSYLIEESRANLCFKIIAEFINKNYKGLCICRTNPNIIKKKYELTDDVNTLLWLTDRDSSKEATISASLESMIYVVEEFIDKSEQSIILLDGLEYLISNNSFNPVLRFIRRLIDKISETTSILLIAVSPKAINEQELKLLERELNPVFLT